MKDGKTHKENLAELLTTFVKDVLQNEKFYSQIGKVISVNESEKTCEVEIINGATIEDVRLQQVASDTGLLIVPEIESVVILGFTDRTTAYIAMFSQISEVVYQNGENGGLIKINAQVEKLNDFSDKYNDLVERLLNWVPVPNDGGAALKTALTTPTPIQKNNDFNSSDFENDKFKH